MKWRRILMSKPRYVIINDCEHCRNIRDTKDLTGKHYWGCSQFIDNISGKKAMRKIPDIKEIPKWCGLSEGLSEWEMTPVYDDHGVPKYMAYRCPNCGCLADKQYDKCPNPFCNVPLDED
jgi:hypothetical protein